MRVEGADVPYRGNGSIRRSLPVEILELNSNPFASSSICDFCSGPTRMFYDTMDIPGRSFRAFSGQMVGYRCLQDGVATLDVNRIIEFFSKAKDLFEQAHDLSALAKVNASLDVAYTGEAMARTRVLEAS